MNLKNVNLQELSNTELQTLNGGGFWKDLGKGFGQFLQSLSPAEIDAFRSGTDYAV